MKTSFFIYDVPAVLGETLSTLLTRKKPHNQVPSYGAKDFNQAGSKHLFTYILLEC